MRIARYFDVRYELPVHVAQLGLTVLVIVLAIARLAIPGAIPSRAYIMGISMGLKSIAILAYQLVTTHVPRFARWRSLKAYAVLNSLEVLFWATVMGLQFQASSNPVTCPPGSPACGVGTAMAVFSLLSLFLAMWAAVCSIIEHRLHRTTANAYVSEESYSLK